MPRAVEICLVLAAALLSCEQPKPAPPPAAKATAPDKAGPIEAAPMEPQPRDAVAAGLHYVEIVLGGAKAEDTLPMVVAIHGLGDDPRNFAALFDTFAEPVRLILPRGLEQSEGGGWSWFSVRARDPDVEALAAGIRTAADAIAGGLAELQQSRKTKGKPIVTGFSQGGMLAFALAVHHPEVVGSAVPIGGWLPPPLLPKDKHKGEAPPVVALHGTADAAVPFEPTKQSVDTLKSLGYPVQLSVYDGVQHVLTPEIQRDLHDLLADFVRAAGKDKGKR